jgi:diguanylate cyclase (GGDEF)-like protein
MKSLTIGRISFLFVLTVSMLVIALGGYFRHEIVQATESIRQSDSANAREEVAQALQTTHLHIREVAQDLAQWEETRQQLAFSDYYALWRDSRVRDSNKLPASVRSIALYDKTGSILARQTGNNVLPNRLPGKPPISYYVTDHGQQQVDYYIPVYADAGGGFLLGYLGIKFDLHGELKRSHSFRYADLSSLQVQLASHTRIDIEKLVQHMQFGALKNSNQVAFEHLFQDALLRLTLAVLAALVLASWLLKHFLVQPLHSLSTQINALRTVNASVPQGLIFNTPLHIVELENVRQSFSDYQERLAALHENLEQNNRDFFDQARIDSLTNVYNRRAYDEDWHGLGEDRRLGKVALLLFDCDHFKAINDTYGHHVGDAVIRAIATSLQSALREGDRLYRLGGDEFATVLVDADPARAEVVAERCLDHLMVHDFRQYGMSEPATISIGIAHSDAGDMCLGELQKRADLAMYAAKRPDSPKMVLYSEGMGEMTALVANRSINAVFEAIRDSSLLEMTYQAVMHLPMVQKEYVEALTRIRFNGELIRPDAIFPIVQARKLDSEFDLSVIRAVARDMASGRLPARQGVSINLSAPSIVNAKVVDAMLALIRAQTAPAIGRKIVVEITETALITQMEIASANIEQLRAAGALVALDDFGSGYSSLRYLATMPVDLVKFDISMVRLLENGDERQKLILEEIARMVLTAGYALVAEGIETRPQLDKIIGMGFTHAQGFYFGKPGEEVEPLKWA